MTAPVAAAPLVYAHSAPRRNNGLAIAAFVLALCNFSLLPVILGHVALAQMRTRNETGSAFAIIALVLGYLQIALIIVVILFIIGGVGFAGYSGLWR